MSIELLALSCTLETRPDVNEPNRYVINFANTSSSCSPISKIKCEFRLAWTLAKCTFNTEYVS